MGTYNILQANIACPYCTTFVDVEIEVFLGNTSMMERLVIGDEYKWVSGKSIKNGGRPHQGNADGEGYTTCPLCQKGFFVKVIVREDRVKDVIPDMEKTASIKSSNATSAYPSQEGLHKSPDLPATESKPRTGQITFNEKWTLTPRIRDLLGQLTQFEVDIYSTTGESDYTFLVPPYLSREEYEQVEELMKEVGKAVKRKVNHIDWYPHGNKYRINGAKKS